MRLWDLGGTPSPCRRGLADARWQRRRRRQTDSDGCGLESERACAGSSGQAAASRGQQRGIQASTTRGPAETKHAKRGARLVSESASGPEHTAGHRPPPARHGHGPPGHGPPGGREDNWHRSPSRSRGSVHIDRGNKDPHGGRSRPWILRRAEEIALFWAPGSRAQTPQMHQMGLAATISLSPDGCRLDVVVRRVRSLCSKRLLGRLDCGISCSCSWAKCTSLNGSAGVHGACRRVFLGRARPSSR